MCHASSQIRDDMILGSSKDAAAKAPAPLLRADKSAEIEEVPFGGSWFGFGFTGFWVVAGFF